MTAESIPLRLMSMLAAMIGAGWLLRDAIDRWAASHRSPGQSALLLETAALDVALALLLLAALVWLGLRVRRAVGPVSRSRSSMRDMTDQRVGGSHER